ncbi:MAG: phosphatidate cytidylyltransferase [Microthrixaceae bacterium]
MDHERPDEKRKGPPTEGVRIIGAEEAAEALERGDVAQRRGDDQPRYGDRPDAPSADGPRPVLRFPLGSSSDPRDIERSPVAAQEPISEQVELPHWTEPATGQVPQILPEDPDADDDIDDWTSFAASAPRWRDDSTRFEHEEGFEDVASWQIDDQGDDPLGALDDRERPTHDDYFSFADLDQSVAPGRSVFADADDEAFVPEWNADTGEDDTLAPPPDARPRRTTASRSRRSPESSYRPQRAARSNGGSGGGDRDLGVAIIVGAAFLAVALILFNMGPAPAMILVTAVIGLAAAELYGVLRQVGYQPVALAGITGTVGLVVGAYNYGTAAIPTVLFLTTATCLLWYLVGAAAEHPVMNVGVTLLGVLWVGLFGSFAALMLSLGDPGLGILLAAILGTVGYDVGGYFVGKNAGRQPLSAASPNKTVEGLLGGCASAFVVIVLLTTIFGLGPIDSFTEGAMVGLAVALFAPLGDLCESLLKRDLGVKDMGSLLPGHGGLLDRFDALLFVLPAVWLLATVKDFFA